MMKKISIWMLAAILTYSLSMTLASCNEDNDEPVVEPTPETPTTPSASTMANGLLTTPSWTRA